MGVRNMKILHIATGFPLSYQGGITNYVRALALKQQENKHKVWIMCNKDGKKDNRLNYFEYDSKITGFRYSKLQDIQGLKLIKKFLDDNQFDIIHLHMILKIDWNLYDILKDYNYIISLHDYYYLCPKIEMMDYQNYPCSHYDANKCKRCIGLLETNDFIYKIYRKNPKVFEKYLHINQNITDIRFKKFKNLLENAKMVLPVSNRVKEIYKNSDIHANYKVVHIGNRSADEYTNDFSYNCNPHIIKVIFIGRLSFNKGVNILFKIADQTDRQKYEFHFYGNPMEFKQRLIEHNIINHGKYDQSDLKKILQDYDLGLVLSVWEDNGPQVVMELLNNHIPVIGTNMGGIPDFITKDNGYIFNPYSDDDFKRLIYFLDNLTIEDIYRLKKNIKRTTTTYEHYNKIMSIYNDILGS